MTSYFAFSALPNKSFYMYRRDSAGNLINDQYPDYLRVPKVLLTEEEKDAYEKLMPGKLEAIEQLKVKISVHEKEIMTGFLDQEGKQISVSEEWDRRVAEHVRVIIAPSGLVEDISSSDDDDDNDECASTTSDDSDVSLPRPYLDSSGDFTYTSEEEDNSSPLGDRGVPVSQDSSKQDPPSNPQLISGESGRSLTEAEVQPRELHRNSPTKSNSARNNDYLFSGPYANFLNELFSHVERRPLMELCRLHGMPSQPDVTFMKKMQTWRVLSYEKQLKLANYIEFVKTGEPNVVSTITDRDYYKDNGERDFIRAHLSQLLRKVLIERAIIVATEMSKFDMAKKLRETLSPELATLFLKTPTEVFILDNALRKCNQVLGVKAFSRDKVPVDSLTSECFVDLKIRLEQQKTANYSSPRDAYVSHQAATERRSSIYGCKLPTPIPKFEEEWTSNLRHAEEHLDDHVMAFQILAGNYKENPEAVEILHEHAVCLRHCVPTYAALQAEVQDTTSANHHLLTPAQLQLSTDLLNTLQKYKELSITTIEEALAHLSELLDPEDEVRDDASGSYENDSDEEDKE